MSFSRQLRIERQPFYVNSRCQEYYRCARPKSNKQYCIKRFNLNRCASQFVEDEILIQTKCCRFRNVLEVMARDYYNSEDKLFADDYILMLQESFQCSLKTWLRRNAPSNDKLVHIAEQLIDQLLPTLAQMQTEDIFHRNLDLQSIFVTNDADQTIFKLGEFGCSRFNLTLSDTTQFKPASIHIGKQPIVEWAMSEVLYFDPQLVQNPHQININKVDVYMYGVMIVDVLFNGTLTAYQKLNIHRTLELLNAYLKEKIQKAPKIKIILENALRLSRKDRPKFSRLLDMTQQKESLIQLGLKLESSGEPYQSGICESKIDSRIEGKYHDRPNLYAYDLELKEDIVSNKSSDKKLSSFLPFPLVAVTQSKLPSERNSAHLTEVAQGSPISLTLKRLEENELELDKSVAAINKYRRQAVYQGSNRLESMSVELYDIRAEGLSVGSVLKTIENIQNLNIASINKIQAYSIGRNLLTFYVQPRKWTLMSFLKNNDVNQSQLILIALGLTQLCTQIAKNPQWNCLQPEMITLDENEAPSIYSIFLPKDLFQQNELYAPPQNERKSASIVWSLGIILFEIFLNGSQSVSKTLIADLKTGAGIDRLKIPRRFNCQKQIIELISSMTIVDHYRRKPLEEIHKILSVIYKQSSQIMHAPKQLAPLVITKSPAPFKPNSIKNQHKKRFDLAGKKASLEVAGKRHTFSRADHFLRETFM